VVVKLRINNSLGPDNEKKKKKTGKETVSLEVPLDLLVWKMTKSSTFKGETCGVREVMKFDAF